MAEPTAREFKALQTLSGGLVEGRGGLPFIGTKTLGDLVANGWINEVPGGGPGGTMGYRITDAGQAVYRAGRTPKKRNPTRLKMIESRIPALRPRLER